MLECHTLLNDQYRVLYVTLAVQLKCFNIVTESNYDNVKLKRTSLIMRCPHMHAIQ